MPIKLKALLSLADSSSKCVKISSISSKEFQTRFIHDKIDHLKNRKKPVSGKVFNGSGVLSSSSNGSRFCLIRL